MVLFYTFVSKNTHTYTYVSSMCILGRPVGRISKLEGPALQKLGGPDHTFCTILAKSWGGPGPPGPYPTYSPE